VAQVGIWPMDVALIEALRAAGAPVAVEVTPEGWGPADARQKALDRRLAEELEWARWAVDRWAEPARRDRAAAGGRARDRS
jgi:hypothetical protein